MISIAVTGTPGTGKTTLAKAIAEKTGFLYLDVGAFIKRKKISQGFDYKRDCEIIDTKQLAQELSKYLQKKKVTGVIIDSHLSHHLPVKELDMVIVTVCDIPVLKGRLEERGYRPEKVRENLDAEIFEICRNEAVEYGHRPLEVDTTKPFAQKKIDGLVLKIMKSIERRKLE